MRLYQGHGTAHGRDGGELVGSRGLLERARQIYITNNESFLGDPTPGECNPPKQSHSKLDRMEPRHKEQKEKENILVGRIYRYKD